MPVKGGRPAVVGVEVLEGRSPDGRLEHRFVVGLVERVEPFSVEACADAVVSMRAGVADQRPCVIVDVGSPQGLALHLALRTRTPASLHRPHAFPGTGARSPLFASFLKAYAEGRVTFEDGLRYRHDLDRALVFYQGSGVKKDGVELDSDEEALVIALGLAITWPSHGPRARGLGVLHVEE